MTNQEANTNYFSALTGLRAIAAFMVYFHHFNPLSKDRSSLLFYNFISEFHVGVSLFFVLSGFLITYRYYDFSKIDYKSYFINRFARIYPMYFLLTSLTVLLTAIFVSPLSLKDFKIYLLNISFLRGFFNDFKFSIIAQGWSLTVEELFYILSPFLFILIKKDKSYILVIPIVSMIFGFVLVYVFKEYSFHGFMESITFMLEYTFFGRCFEFIVGISLAIFLKNFKDFKPPHTTYFGLIMIIGFIFVMSILRVSVGTILDKIIIKLLELVFLPTFGFAALIFGLIKNKTFISKILQTKIFQILGKSSYIFYLIHMGVFVKILSKFSTNYIFLFLVINFIAIILFLTLESPVNNYIRIRFNKKRKIY